MLRSISLVGSSHQRGSPINNSLSLYYTLYCSTYNGSLRAFRRQPESLDWSGSAGGEAAPADSGSLEPILQSPLPVEITDRLT